MATKKSNSPTPVTVPTKRTLFIILNPAPFLRDENANSDTPNRANTPWYVSIPELSVQFMACDDNGDPITGFWADRDAQSYASNVYAAAMRDADFLARLRENPQWPDQIHDGYKLMERAVPVPLA